MVLKSLFVLPARSVALSRRLKSLSQRIRFFDLYTEEYMLEAQSLVAEEFSVLMDFSMPIKNFLFLTGKAKNKREARNK